MSEPLSCLVALAIGQVGSFGLVAAIDGRDERREVLGPAVIELAAPCGQEVAVEVTGEGWWSGRMLVAAGPEASPTPVSLHRGGLVAATLRSKVPGVVVEAPVRLHAELAGGGLAGEVGCELEDGRAICAAPVGVVDLRLKARGFASVFRFGVKIIEGGEVELGPLELVPGASVVGWIEREDGAPLTADAAVELVVARQGGGMRGASLDRLSQSGRPSARGLFQLEGVPAGVYDLVGRDAGAGEARLGAIEVREGLEARVRQPLVLPIPRRLEVSLFPPIAPSLRPWSLRVVHDTPPAPRVVAEAEANVDGIAILEGLPPGPVVLGVVDSGSGRNFHSQRIESVGRDEWLPIELPLVPVEGLVLLGTEPLVAARVVFGGHGRAGSVELLTDEEGAFAGVLPRAGTWRVAIEAEDPRVRRVLRGIEVETPRGRKPARVSIELDDRAVEGTVVDERGFPVAGAMVELRPIDEADSIHVTSDRLGMFELYGLPRGRLELSARNADTASDPVAVELLSATTEVELVLRPRRQLEVRVLASGEPVPGATVGASVSGSATVAASGVTDALGVATLDVPASTAALAVVVSAPRRSLVLGRVPLPAEGEPLVLDLPSSHGTLEIAGFDGNPDGREIVLLHRGGWASLWSLLRWTAAHRDELAALPAGADGTIHIPRLAAGAWSVCELAIGSADWFAAAAFGVPGPGCSAVDLAPGGVARVEVGEAAGAAGSPD